MKTEYNIPAEISTHGTTIDHRGGVFGKVLVHYPCGHEKNASGNTKHLVWLCECDCGVMFTARSGSLNMKHTSSCGRCEYVNPQLFKHQPELPRKKYTGQMELPLDTGAEPAPTEREDELDGLLEFLVAHPKCGREGAIVVLGNEA